MMGDLGAIRKESGMTKSRKYSRICLQGLRNPGNAVSVRAEMFVSRSKNKYCQLVNENLQHVSV